MNPTPKRFVTLIWSSLILLAAPVNAATVTANFTAATTVPVTAASYAATGNTVNLTLGFAPPAGTNLIVVKNTGMVFIQGTFDNLSQGQAVNLTFGGITYPFVANYFGGTGNDLVLQWANTRLLAWGDNSAGQLGNGNMLNALIPVPPVMTDMLADQTITSVATGGNHSLALCADGTLAAWGYNGVGQLGDNSTTTRMVPTRVNTTGTLAGKTVIAIATGGSHSLALCSDGTLAAWGINDSGQLGTNTTTNSPVPVLVDRTGVLDGKTVIAIAAGSSHSLALCSDGTLASWGYNSNGQLGNNTTTNSPVPVWVNQTGVLAGKTVIAVDGGGSHSIALCSDGTLAAWGNHDAGQLGTYNLPIGGVPVPVLVDQSGILSAKTVNAISAGSSHNLALCSDGTLAEWGYNFNGQLGIGSSGSTSFCVTLPTRPNQTGVLAGRTITAMFAGWGSTFALCTDGTLTAWGYNFSGQLGNGSTTDSNLPVSVNTSALRPGERLLSGSSGGSHNLMIVASPPPPVATTLAATAIADTRATLNGSVNANGTTTGVAFEYGLTSSYGITIAAAPASLTGSTTTAVSAAPNNLLAGTTYHYRVVATSAGGTPSGEDMTFTTPALASLSNLTLSSGSLAPAFSSATTSYIATVPSATSSITVTPVCEFASSSVTVNGVTVPSGTASAAIGLTVGANSITTVVTAAAGSNTKTYTVTVTRLPAAFTYTSATTVPVTAGDFLATGNTASFTLSYAPTAGTTLTVVKNTGLNPIQGVFDNLAQGQKVNLTYSGIAYSFVANYFGGTGNDLVLHWANTRVLAWGQNTHGELGNDSYNQSNAPIPVEMTGVLAGKTLIALSSGWDHNLALCADGTVATWGDYSIRTPVLVDRTGVLAGKVVIAIDTGRSYSLGLCSDGTVSAWGENSNGQLGNGSTNWNGEKLPVLVNTTGILSGKSVSAIAAGFSHSLVLCSDGTLAAWGDNPYGELGNNSTSNSTVPVLVDRTGVLAGKTVIAVAAGSNISFALCSDGTLASWGFNAGGQLGNNNTTNSSAPVLVNRTGVLAGKTLLAISPGIGHCVALCSDGTVAAWGDNTYGQLGNGSTTFSSLPVLVNRAGVLSGKTVAAIAAGFSHSLALCSDGTMAAWGYGNTGQLGNNSTTNSTLPVLVSTTALGTSERPMTVAAGAFHNLALVASPMQPVATTLAATGTTDTSVTLKGSVNAQGTSTAVTFEYGLTSAYGITVAATPASVSGSTTTATNTTLSGLLSGTTYHYRVVATNGGGTVVGDDMSFATSNSASLANLSLSSGTLLPGFSSIQTSYAAAVEYAVSNITVTPQAEAGSSAVKVNGVSVASGTASGPINLAVGTNVITTVVTPVDGAFTKTYSVTVTRLPESYAFLSATSVPVTVTGFLATGHTATLALNFAPTVGTPLTVVKNTGSNFIQGAFDNLAQGQRVQMTYGGVTYSFVANYFGGTGNDLVLQWANHRMLAWGNNSYGQLGNNSTSTSSVPLPVDMGGVLADKTILAAAAGAYHNLALCSDGMLAAWGSNDHGHLGNGGTANSLVPVAVDQTGVLSGKTVIAIAAGSYHNLALCADGTLAAWGYNNYGQLGNNSTTQSKVPVLVTQTGVLAGKTVVAVSAGNSHSLVLCSDGTLAAWGYNSTGQLGNTTTTNSSVPVLVTQTGVLAGKSVVGVYAGSYHNLALCADGKLAAWGSNNWGGLGNNNSTNSSVPVWVNQTGVLAAKTVAAIAGGAAHSITLCTDGTVATWGFNYYGQLGNNSTTESNVPVLAYQTGVLAGKTVTAIAAGENHNFALCSDGTLAAWGYNNSGQLGNAATSNSSVPVLVDTTMLKTGERLVAIRGGSLHSLALVPIPPPPAATTLAASGITDTEGTLNGSVNAQGNSTTVTFEYGLTTSYGTTVAATPASATGSTTTAATATLSGLLSGETYHYRINASSAGGTVKGTDLAFTTSTSACLSGLTTNRGELIPSFDRNVTNYSLAVSSDVATITLTPVVFSPDATVYVDGVPVASGTVSGPLDLTDGNNRIDVTVIAAGGGNTKTYTVMVTRLPAIYGFDSPASVPVTISEFQATGNTVTFALNFAPPAGTDLTAVRNTGTRPIQGTFANLEQGQQVNLTYGGISYSFMANYYGGTGNDLVLHWAHTRIVAWGDNSSGTLGNNNTTSSKTPVPVDMSGVLAGKTVIAVAAGSSFNLVLCADGTLAAWGSNGDSQLGNNSTTSSSVPVMVNQSGVLAGKTVVGIATGYRHGLALCSDGTLAAWGVNASGQLGNNSTTNSSVPVLVTRTGVLAGKTVIAVAAAGEHSLVLCSDGTLASWGANGSGQLGNNSLTSSPLPVMVARTGVLAGKTVAGIAAGTAHNLALCTDGNLAAWGSNSSGQLGNNTATNSSVPVLVTQTGVLSGKSVTAIAAGDSHSLALCSDGTVATWGYNIYGQLGNTSTTNSSVPVWITKTGVLSGKSVTAIAAGRSHSLALCSDGPLAAWGYNSSSQLGDNSTTNRSMPVWVSATQLKTGERFVAMRGASAHSLALVATPPPPAATTLAATGLTDTGCTLNGSVNAQGSTTSVTFEYGLTTSYGTTVAATPAAVADATTTIATATLSGLLSGETYHYRMCASSAGGTTKGADLTFTTSTSACLSGLTPGHGTLMPVFARNTTSYSLAVPFAVAATTLTPEVLSPGATVNVNGIPVASGTASGALALSVGNNRIDVAVSAAEPANIKIHTVTVIRLPAVFTYNSATDVPVTVGDFPATGIPVNFALNFAPTAGTCLTVVRNTGSGPIQGAFSNLAQGQKVNLSYGGIIYPFVANYYGGTGNDLVLQWGSTRLLSWGYNASGQLGNVNLAVPGPVDTTGVLKGRTVMAVATGGNHSLALCADGTLAAWGSNVAGQLGNNSNTNSLAPVLVDQTGVLAGKTIIAVAAGFSHSLALCADGVVAAWGGNAYGQLGDNSTISSLVPVLVNRTGILAGKAAVAIAAGDSHSLALCADGSVAAWGLNGYGQLGNNSTTTSSLPVLVSPTGVLAGKAVVAICAGAEHCLALCADGSLAAWGNNAYGVLGNNSSINSSIPILVDTTGVLAGKTVTAIASGRQHNHALCADGTLAAWGSDRNGQLGDNYNPGSTDAKYAPWPVVNTGVLAGKTVISMAAGSTHGLALCSDGTLTSWGGFTSSGETYYGELGNYPSKYSLVPALVYTGTLETGEHFMAASTAGSSHHTLALVASPPPPLVTTLAATAITDTSAVLNGSINAQDTSTPVSFEYGLTSACGTMVTATPASVSGTVTTATSATLSGLVSGATYHYRLIGRGVPGEDLTFTTSTVASLTNLTTGSGTLFPAFSSSGTRYVVTLPNATSSITLTPTTASATSTVKVNGVTVASGTASAAITLPVGDTVINTVVTHAGSGITQTYIITVTRLPAVLTFSAATTVPVTVSDLVASGKSTTFALAYAPTVGTNLTVVKNTGTRPIQGTFDNLTQGQRVAVTYAGVAYSFIANYHGGTGNDLVLQWANTRLLAWGTNPYGQLGNNSTTSSTIPVPVVMTGVLAGKSISSVASGSYHGFALCADGTLAAWGKNNYGQLGNNSTINAKVPVLVERTGVLANTTVVAISAGGNHTLALCADGTLAAWGEGQLGNNSSTGSLVPVAVDQTGVLAGRTIIAIATGSSHSLVLCADGSLAAWGSNGSGQLGNHDTTQSNVPVLVEATGSLYGKTVVAIAVGNSHSLALCSDGTVVAWGGNGVGQLGNNSTLSSVVPVAVARTGGLAGKTVTAITAGKDQSLALCSDGTVAAWGSNYYGEAGNGNSAPTSSSVPVAVDTSGVLAGKTVTSIASGDNFNLAACSDGSAAAWGFGSFGQLGDNTSYSASRPVAINTSNLTAGERFMTVDRGAGISFSIGLFALPTPPLATTLAATAVNNAGATLNGSVQPNGTTTAVTFEYGLTTAYGTTVSAAPSTVTGTGAKTASANLGGLVAGTIYHYRIIATNLYGTALGADMTFTPEAFANLSGLSLSSGMLAPAFAGNLTSYIATVPFSSSSITLTPVTVYGTATVKVNGGSVASGSASAPLPLAVGNNTVSVVVTAGDGITTKTYQVTVTRLPDLLTFAAAGDVPVTAGDFVATGNTVNFALGYAPQVGASLMGVNNTGGQPIRGTFSNLSQGQTVNLTYGGVTYAFVANYYGGTGNDLVLQWANTRPMAWGWNTYGQLGNNDTADRKIPAAVTSSGVLAGKTIIAIATGGYHSLALCSDGTLATWGYNYFGQLGNNSNANISVPVAITSSGILNGKRVIAISAGFYHSLALCSDGTVATWGINTEGELGNNDTADRNVPVAVTSSGILSGKTVIAVAGGEGHNLVLCSDGTMAAWGYNNSGQLGNNDTTNSRVPVAVTASGILSGKTVVVIDAGTNHNLAICSDGTVAAWGYNQYGQLGNNSNTDSLVPVAVTTSGILSGKTVVAIAADQFFSLALCSDGKVAAWGINDYGQLGINSTTASRVPVAVNTSGILSGKTVVAISASTRHSLALCSDGSLAAWGGNWAGQLGNNSTSNSYIPVAVNTSSLAAGQRFFAIGHDTCSEHNLALVAMPLPVATAQPASAITGLGATLNGMVNANGNTTSVSFEFGLTSTYGNTIAGIPLSVTGGSNTSVHAAISGLTPGTLYHYRVVASSYGGIVRCADLTFTTLSDNAQLAALALSDGDLAPLFEKTTTSYLATVAYVTEGVTVTPVTDHPGASVKVEGTAVASGAASGGINLPVGNTTITTMVTAEDGIATKTYSVTVTRLPQEFVFNSATDVPVTSNGFSTGGYQVNLVLGYPPVPGTVLTMVNNTGLGFIHGTFGNLAQGQRVTLNYGGTNYDFVANYFGGSGNDLVLQWADTKVMSWGSNSYGQLGDATTTRRLAPAMIDNTGVLAGKTIMAVDGGYLHSLALCSDGTLAAWGYNVYGQLGNNSAAASNWPVAVDQTGVLAGKTVIAISAGPFHNLALCSDGTMAAWGYNNYGQLGTGDKVTSRVPVLVNPVAALAGKQVVAVAAAAYSSFALCADGSLTAWGYNDEGELGDGTTANSSMPVAVDTSGVLAGKQIASLSAGQYHTLALCSDGTLVAWGYNNRGQLGNDSNVSSKVPVAIGSSGILSGKTVVTVRASGAHSLALCADGTLAAWGWNHKGQLGVTGMTQSPLPLAVDMTGVTAGTRIAQIAVGGIHNLVLGADGTVAAWGDNAYGQLGNNSLTTSPVPVAVDMSSLEAGARVMFIASGSAALHNLAVVALPSASSTPLATTLQGAPLGDSDHDGIANLIEYAFGLSGANSAARLPQPQRAGDNLEMRFTEPAGVTGITYGAEWSATLQPGSWKDIPDSGTGNEHIFSMPAATSPNLFLRLKVTGR